MTTVLHARVGNENIRSLMGSEDIGSPQLAYSKSLTISKDR